MDFWLSERLVPGAPALASTSFCRLVSTLFLEASIMRSEVSTPLMRVSSCLTISAGDICPLDMFDLRGEEELAYLGEMPGQKNSTSPRMNIKRTHKYWY